MSMENLRDVILSDEYLDFILPYYDGIEQDFSEYGIQFFNSHLVMIHSRRPSENLMNYLETDELRYTTLPKLYSLLNLVSLESSGILPVQNQPSLDLKGRNVIVGFIDTGIDYTHSAFLTRDKRTRILALWDQNIQTGQPPFDLSYGSVYFEEDINQALSSSNPFEVVPSDDEIGHGTALAGIACGSSIPEQDFSGAAPLSQIAMVKLKPAKQYLREIFYHTSNEPVFQETDIMMAIRFFTLLAREQKKPLVLCLGLGTNQGAHSGHSYLAKMFTELSNYWGFHPVIAAGNEAGKAHHFFSYAPTPQDYIPVELSVPANSSGFTLELWGDSPEIYDVGFESPLGEVISRIPSRVNFRETLDFILEDTTIFLSSSVIQNVSGEQFIFMRFSDPTPGIWKIRVYAKNQNRGSFHLWLPISGFLSPDVIFLRPNPDTTITDPATSPYVITISAYNAYNNSLFLNSSRGFTRLEEIKPDLTAPGVNVSAPSFQNTYTTITGTSAACALTAGACALLVEWGQKRMPPKIFNTAELIALLIRGARRSEDRIYPNQEWGFGILDIYQIFQTFASF